MEFSKLLPSLVGAFLGAGLAMPAYASEADGVALADLPVIGCIEAVASCLTELSEFLHDPQGGPPPGCGRVHVCGEIGRFVLSRDDEEDDTYDVERW